MFERRLKILLILPVCCALVILGRLFQLQVLQGGEYERKVDAALSGPIRQIPPLRGRILDRTGRVLAADEPTHDVAVHYGVLAMDPEYLSRLASNLRRRESAWAHSPADELKAEIVRRIDLMWATMARASGKPESELRARGAVTCATVERLRRHVWNNRLDRGQGQDYHDVRLKEQDYYHAMLRDVAPDVRTRVEVELPREPFVRVEPSVRRVWREETRPVCHLIGEIGQVSSEQIESDPLADDPLACYRSGDAVGVSGVERLAEPLLRGKRGLEERSIDGEVVQHIDPVDGHDARLTIDLALQSKIAEILSRAVTEHPISSGASCVVIDTASREILAMVSVPNYTRADIREDYAKLRDDVLRRPLVNRAIQDEYPPGSTLKPVTLLAGLANRLVTPQTTVFCNGSLVPGSKNWHCWTYWKGQSGHGTVTAETALQHSCNIYFYTLGERLNAQRLTDFIRDFCRGPQRSFGGRAGTGLVAEHFGIIPTLDWINRRKNRSYSPSDARNYSIGQGEVQLTPLQVANLFATVATGVYRDPTLLADDPESRPVQRFANLRPEDWELVRQGLFLCVNSQGGTAYSFARMDDLEVCGKTGSAQCVPRVTQRRYTFATPDDLDAEQQSVDAPTIERARELLRLPPDAPCLNRETIATWPPRDPETKDYPTHAWFAGFAPRERPRIAISVLIEYGGAGGRNAGPIAREILEVMLNDPQGYLTRPPRDVAALEAAP